MIPIDSYQDARRVSYVVLTRITSPASMCGRQLLGVAVIAMSHEIGPRLSK